LKTFWVDLKACLGLVLPNQYCPIAVWENEADFWVILLHRTCLLLRRPAERKPFNSHDHLLQAYTVLDTLLSTIINFSTVYYLALNELVCFLFVVCLILCAKS